MNKIKVKAGTRKTKSGKVVNIKSYERKGRLKKILATTGAVLGTGALIGGGLYLKKKMGKGSKLTVYNPVEAVENERIWYKQLARIARKKAPKTEEEVVYKVAAKAGSKFNPQLIDDQINKYISNTDNYRINYGNLYRQAQSLGRKAPDPPLIYDYKQFMNLDAQTKHFLIEKDKLNKGNLRQSLYDAFDQLNLQDSKVIKSMKNLRAIEKAIKDPNISQAEKLAYAAKYKTIRDNLDLDRLRKTLKDNLGFDDDDIDMLNFNKYYKNIVSFNR